MIAGKAESGVNNFRKDQIKLEDRVDFGFECLG